MKLPTQIDIGHETIKIEVVPTHLSYELCREEGSFHSTLRTIFINEDIVNRGGATLVNVLIHELMHVIHWLDNLSKDSTEEDIVNSMSNGMTELLLRTDLLTFIYKELNNGKKK
jgi:hypothetical protein